MLQTHRDQENFVHGHQLAAAAKPQNQGLKPLGTKTPGNKAPKTPFRVPLNNENVVLGGGKSVLKPSGGKAKENQQQVWKKGGDVDKSAFVTPAGPRTRAPLGMKTTNAKARIYQTPAPLTNDNRADKSIQKTVSPRLRRPKVKVHQPEPIVQEESEEEAEIEYCPPKEVPLPDHPSDDDFGPDKTFPQLEGANFTRGYPAVYFNPELPSGETYIERRIKDRNAKYEADFEARCEKEAEDEWNETEARIRAELGMSPKKKTLQTATAKPATAKPLAPKSINVQSKKPTAPKLSSRDAAAALAAPTKSSAARQTAPHSVARGPAPSARARIARKPRVSGAKAPLHGESNASKHATASAVARSTLGYSKGRAAATNLRSSPPKVEPLEAKARIDNAPSSALASLGLGDEDEELFGAFEAGVDDDDDRVFQLTLHS